METVGTCDMSWRVRPGSLWWNLVEVSPGLGPECVAAHRAEVGKSLDSGNSGHKERPWHRGKWAGQETGSERRESGR
jgi:hypothetical protein